MPRISAVALISVCSAILGGLIVWGAQGHYISLRPEGLTYAELAAVLLGVASLMVGVIGIGVAILAIWGFKYFKQIAVSEAQRKVSADLDAGESKRLIEETARSTAAVKVEQELVQGEARKILESEVARAIATALANGGIAGAELADSRREEQAKYPELDEAGEEDGH